MKTLITPVVRRIMGKIIDFIKAFVNNPSIDEVDDSELAKVIAANPDAEKRILALEASLKVSTNGKNVTRSKPVVEKVNSSKKPAKPTKAIDEKAVQKDER